MAIVSVLSVPARAPAESSIDWKYDNPFCDVVAAVVPLPDVVASVTPIQGGMRYVVALFARRGTTLAAHVTLVSDGSAYDAVLPDTNLSGPLEDRRREPVVVTLPAADQLKYFFVDSYALDGRASVTCPSYVFPIGETVQAQVAGAAVIPAVLLQSIEKLPCGQTYQDAGTGRDFGGVIGRYGNKPLSVTYHVYIDSKGHAISEKLLQSSGVEGVDSAALGSIQQQEFQPAQFLCTPVVSEINIRMDYVP
jgi:hypothetical protein